MKRVTMFFLVLLLGGMIVACTNKAPTDGGQKDNQGKLESQAPSAVASTPTLEETISYVQRAQLVLDKAKKKLADGEVDGYVELLMEVMDINPKNKEAMFLLGKAYYQGTGVEVNMQSALYWFKMLDDTGYCDWGEWLSIYYKLVQDTETSLYGFLPYDPSTQDGLPEWNTMYDLKSEVFVRVITENIIIDKYCTEEFLKNWVPLDEHTRQYLRENMIGFSDKGNSQDGNSRILVSELILNTEKGDWKFRVKSDSTDGIISIEWIEGKIIE